MGRIQVEAFHAWIYREVISRAHIFPSRLKSTQWTLLPVGYLIKRDTHTHIFGKGMGTHQKEAPERL